MIPIAAVEKAIEGGWTHVYDDWQDIELHWQIVALDPLFWSSLGKALRWGENEIITADWAWREQAHRFYDDVLLRKDTELFWKRLLE
jgi:hypothetical protein